MRNICSAIALSLAIAVSGCTSVDETLRTASTVSIEKSKPRFGDSDPIHEWEGGAPFGFPIHGVDVSKYQGDIDWQQFKRNGVEFAFIKATEGGDRLDEKFAQYMHDARRAGIPSSAYHFYYFCTSARKQAQWFIRNVPKMKGSLPHVLDMEWNHHSPSCKKRPPAAKVRSEMEIFMSMIEKHYGKRPIVYTTVDFHEENLVGAFQKDVFWLRSVKAHPKITYPGRPWGFWQYTGSGRMSGVKGNIDINVFAGSREQWNDWLKKATR